MPLRQIQSARRSSAIGPWLERTRTGEPSFTTITQRAAKILSSSFGACSSVSFALLDLQGEGERPSGTKRWPQEARAR